MNFNITQHFFNHAKSHPDDICFVIPKNYSSLKTLKEEILTYKDFSHRVIKYRKGLSQKYKKGDRIIILAPINEDVYALMMAMFSLGMVAVFLDPGIGLKKILTAISDSNAKAIISINKLLKYHFFIPGLWQMDKYSMDKCQFGVMGIDKINKELSKHEKNMEIVASDLAANDHVLITFTSGSTGRSKGSDRNAQNIYNQIETIKKNWNCDKSTIDFPSFPMFGFMNAIMGIKTIVPAVNFAKISDFNEEVIIYQMKKWSVTRTCGSYIFNKKVSEFLKNKNEKIETLKNIALGGCPVTKEFCENLKNVYPNARVEIIYGSTEVAPISSMEINDYLNSKGTGFPVGHVYPEIELMIVDLPKKIKDIKLDHLKDYEVKKGAIGEIILRSGHTVQSYIDNPSATLENKLKPRDGLSFHRTGDTGYIDQDNRLWLVGRLNDIIEVKYLSTLKTLHPFEIETHVDELDQVSRSAIIQNSHGKIILFLELKSNVLKDSISSELCGKINEILPDYLKENMTIQYIDKIPVDDRHQSKINRVLLRTTI